MKRIFVCGLVLFLALAVGAAAANPMVTLETTKGSIVLELFPDKAPATVESFLDNVGGGFYEGTIFHRVMKDFMVQGGGFTTGGQLKPTSKLLHNEADNGLSNSRGTVAMARKNDPHSASVQFYINHADNKFLDFKAKSPRGWGYTVFGQVVEGMDVVDAISNVQVRRTSISNAQPLENVVILKATIAQPAGEASTE